MYFYYPAMPTALFGGSAPTDSQVAQRSGGTQGACSTIVFSRPTVERNSTCVLVAVIVPIKYWFPTPAAGIGHSAVGNDSCNLLLINEYEMDLLCNVLNIFVYYFSQILCFFFILMLECDGQKRARIQDQNIATITARCRSIGA